MRFYPKDYAEALLRMTADGQKEKIDGRVDNFCKYLSQHRLLSSLPKIMKELDALWKKKHHRSVLHLTFAREQKEALIQRVKQRAQKHWKLDEVEIIVSLDKTLLGGCIIQYEDWRIDASIKRRLQQLRQRL